MNESGNNLDLDNSKCRICKEPSSLSDGILCNSCQKRYPEFINLIRRLSEDIEDLEIRISELELYLAL